MQLIMRATASEIVAAAAQRKANADARIGFPHGTSDPAGMQQQPAAPTHRVDLRRDFLGHPMAMDLPIASKMALETPAFTLRRARPQNVGMRPDGVNDLLPSFMRGSLAPKRT